MLYMWYIYIYIMHILAGVVALIAGEVVLKDTSKMGTINKAQQKT